MLTYLYMHPLLVRFTKDQRTKIRKESKRFKISEAEYVRRCVTYPLEIVEHESRRIEY